MKQIIQDLKTGETILEDVPAPQVSSKKILVKTTHSLVSLGTERMLVEFGKANYFQKARQQPDKVKQVVEKIKTDGIIPTYTAIDNKLNQPLPLGYCNVGEVIAVGHEIHSIAVGDRVVSNGPHAEIVSVPENLCAKIPDSVSDETASFTVLGAIALQGIRLTKPSFGEIFVVFGLGLIGLMTVDILIANGCRVIGIDMSDSRLSIASNKGAIIFNPSKGDEYIRSIHSLTNEVGVDGVIVTAAAKNDDIMHQSAQMCRKRARITLVGVVNLNIIRDDFYKKELTFRVSCSYGPGRYDDAYEGKGYDYPIGYVRWTEKRNFLAILDAMEKEQINVVPLISRSIDIGDYKQIYENLDDGKILASILEYNSEEDTKLKRQVTLSPSTIPTGSGIIGIIGAGNYTSSNVLPSLTRAKAPIKYIGSAGGLSAVVLSKKYRIPHAISDMELIYSDPEISGVMITTRHNMHANMIIRALNNDKHVFVEKPLCISPQELEEIVAAHGKSDKSVVVGFNRRFSDHSIKVKEHMKTGPFNISVTMNAGYIEQESWVQDMELGGGRIIGEACHLIDLCSYFVGREVTAVSANSMGLDSKPNSDNASILMKYADGSNAVINYFSNGSKAYPKERVEVFGNGNIMIIDNWRITKGYGIKGFKKYKSKQDKGHDRQFSQLSEFWKKGGVPPIDFASIKNTTDVTFAAIESMTKGTWINI